MFLAKINFTPSDYQVGKIDTVLGKGGYYKLGDFPFVFFGNDYSFSENLDSVFINVQQFTPLGSVKLNTQNSQMDSMNVIHEAVGLKKMNFSTVSNNSFGIKVNGLSNKTKHLRAVILFTQNDTLIFFKKTFSNKYILNTECLN
jgi:hypothetical protein